MKKSPILLTMVWFLSYFAHAQIKWLNPQPSGDICSKIVFADTVNGFVFNSTGSLFKTNNQGTSWQLAQTFKNMECFDLYDSVGIIAGFNGTFYLSSDNGNTWQRKETGIATSFAKVKVVSRDTFFLASLTSIYKSYDRGQTWQQLNLSSFSVQSFDFVNGKLGFVGRNNEKLVKTLDGGNTWQEISLPGFSSTAILCIKFLNADTGYISRESQTLLKTVDGGVTWQSSNIYGGIFAMSFPTTKTGFLAGSDGVLYRTVNEGGTWESVNPLNAYIYRMDLYSISFITPKLGFAAGGRGRIIKTVDGGNTWQAYSKMYNDIAAFSFPNIATGYAVSGLNAYKTTDGSKTWNELPITVPQFSQSSTFENAHFFSKDTGLVISGYPSRISRTYNGGQTWTPLESSNEFIAYEHSVGLSFINDSTGYLSLTTDVANFGLYKTKNRGQSWQNIYNPPSATILNNIQFINEEKGYASGYSQVQKTNDSGKTWITLRENYYPIQSLWFVNEAKGFMADNDGLRQTNDSGKTWSSANKIDFNGDILAIKFLNSYRGFITTSMGAIYQTANGGNTWVSLGKVVQPNGFITFTGNRQVYFGGKFGNIISASTDTSFGTESNCLGNNFTFISDIKSAYYFWEVDDGRGNGFVGINDNETYAGANSYALTINNPPAAWQGYTYRCNFGAFGQFSKAHVLDFKMKWTGAISTAWENPANWSCGVVPDISMDVIIPSGSTVSIHSNASVNSLKINAGASVTVAAGYTLTVVK